MPSRSPSFHASFTWSPAATMAPGLISANFGQGPMLKPIKKAEFRDGRYTNPVWVIDYTFTSDSYYRVISDRRPWTVRRAQTVHLYPPGTVYWERYPIGLSRNSGFFLFNAGNAGGSTNVAGSANLAGSSNATGLDQLIHHPKNPDGFAEIEDPADQIGSLIRSAATIGARLGNGGFWDAQAMLCQAIGLLHASIHINGPIFHCRAPADVPETLSQRIDQLLRSHLHQRISLRQVARQANISESTLTHVYRNQTGRSVGQAALDMRLDLARAMLLRGERLKTIAHTLGFADPFHLSRVFKRRIGLSPREYAARSRV